MPGSDKTPSMSKGSWNDGRETGSAHASQTIQTDYGLDRSSMSGAQANERVGKFGGSNTDLSHSLSGASARQEENDGRKSKINEQN